MPFIKNLFHKYLYLYFLFLLFSMLYSRRVFIDLTVVGAILGLILLILNWRIVLPEITKNRYLYSALALLIPIGIATLDSLNPIKPESTFLTMLLFLFIGVLPIYMRSTCYRFKSLEILLFIVLLAISVDAIIQWQTDYHVLGYSPVGNNRVRGVFYPWYHLSYFLGTFAPIILFVPYYLLEKETTLLRIIGSITAIVLFIIAILLGGARAGLISLIVTMLLFMIFLFSQKRIKHKLRFFGIVLLITTIAIGIASQSSVVQNRFITIFANYGNENFFSQLTSLRPNIWYVAFQEIPNYWVNGIGPLGFDVIYQTYPDSYKIFPFVSHVHLHGLEILIETGIIGFIPYILLCGYLLWRMFTAKAGNMWIMTGFIAMMPINTHVGLFEYYWFPIVWVPIMLGLTLAYKADKNPTNSN